MAKLYARLISLCGGVVFLNILELIILIFLLAGPIVTTQIYDLTLYYLLIAQVPCFFAAILGIFACGYAIPAEVAIVRQTNDMVDAIQKGAVIVNGRYARFKIFIASGARTILIVYLVFEALNIVGALLSLVWRAVLQGNCNNNAASACHTQINYNIEVGELVLVCILFVVALIAFAIALFIQRSIYNIQAMVRAERTRAYSTQVLAAGKYGRVPSPPKGY